MLLKVLRYIDTNLRVNPEQKGPPEIYWTIENNGIGQAAILAIDDVGEERFPGVFVHEPRRRGRVSRSKGLNTGEKSKLNSCSKLKSLIESGRMQIRSQALIQELKNFVSKGKSFEAKWGANDDLVMATILIIRMIQIIQTWDPKSTENFKETIDDSEDYTVDPMPVSVLSY